MIGPPQKSPQKNPSDWSLGHAAVEFHQNPCKKPIYALSVKICEKESRLTTDTMCTNKNLLSKKSIKKPNKATMYAEKWTTHHKQ